MPQLFVQLFVSYLTGFGFPTAQNHQDLSGISPRTGIENLILRQLCSVRPNLRFVTRLPSEGIRIFQHLDRQICFCLDLGGLCLSASEPAFPTQGDQEYPKPGIPPLAAKNDNDYPCPDGSLGSGAASVDIPELAYENLTLTSSAQTVLTLELEPIPPLFNWATRLPLGGKECF